MQIALIADTFPPFRTSGAVQLRDLSREFVRQGHNITVILPSGSLKKAWAEEYQDGVHIVRLKSPNTKDIGYFKRTLNELIMPFSMLQQLNNSPLSDKKWDGIIFYAPSIFFGPLASAMKKASRCKSYLIIRDIFPEWAVDMGLMGRGLPYLFFDAVARYQYSVADVIGVQTSGNLVYFDRWRQQPGRKLEVLENWLGQPANIPCSIHVNETNLAGRKILVYAGNMGVAQGMDIFMDLAERFKHRQDVGFLFVGRGSDASRFSSSAKKRELANVEFFDEIDPDEIPDLYSQCSAGIVALASGHKSHNIPGKFVAYMQCGLPVIANVNAGNDLAKLIRDFRVGQVCESNHIDELSSLTEQLLIQIDSDVSISNRCKELFDRDFSCKKAVNKILTALLN